MEESNYELFGVECNDGWNSILEPIFNYIKKYNESHDEKIEVLQVKEKFGELRFYTNFYTDELKNLIRQAEEESYSTCELCGTKTNVGKTLGWITTCCKNCAKEIAKHHSIKWKPLNENDIKYYIFDTDGNERRID